MKYEQIAELLNGIAERFDWEKIMEGDNIIGLKQVRANIFINKKSYHFFWDLHFDLVYEILPGYALLLLENQV